MGYLNRIDYAVILVFLVAVTVQGLVVSGRQRSLRDYFAAGGNMPWWAVSLSLYASLLTPMSFVGVTSWVYQKDSRWMIGSSVIGMLSIYFAARVWVPLWDRLRPLSIFEYLENRYTALIRFFGAAVFLVQMTFWLGNELVTTASSFQLATGISGLKCLFIIICLNTLYTVTGGSCADIWTDIAQFCVFLIAFAVIAGLVLRYFNYHPAQIYQIASASTSPLTGHPHTTMVSTEFNLHTEGTIWAILCARVYGVFTFGTEQVCIQRLIAIKGRRGMYKALLGFTIIDLVVTTLTVFVAWGLFAFYQRNPENMQNVHPDQVLMRYSLYHTPTFVRGLVMAALLAALMASYGTALNSISSVMINDCYRRLSSATRSQRHYLFISRLVTLATGLLIFLFATWQYHHRELTALQRMGQLSVLVSGPIACFFLLGVLSRRSNTFGAMIAGIAAMAFSLLFNGFPGAFPPIIPGINWMWLGGMSTAAGLICGYLASLLVKPRPAAELQGLTVWTSQFQSDSSSLPTSLVTRTAADN